MGACNSVESLVDYVERSLPAFCRRKRQRQRNLDPEQVPTSISDVEHAGQHNTDLQLQQTDEIQALKTVLQAQTWEIQLLKNRLNVDLAPAGPKKKSDAPNLPPEILSQIFNQIDTRSLLKCRAVCTSWRNSIDNSPDQMRKFRFLIIHPRCSLDLTSLINIFPHVRAITFNRDLEHTDDQLKDLFTAIAPTLESVAFGSFDKECMFSTFVDAQPRVASSVFQHCYRLKELVVLGRQKMFLRGISLINITTLTINVHCESAETRLFHFKVVHELPKLSTITLFSATDAHCILMQTEEDKDDTYKVILNSVCDHMIKYPGVLKNIILKLGDGEVSDDRFQELIAESVQLFLLAGKHSVVVSTEIGFELDCLHCLVEFEEQTDKLAVNLKNCSAITNGTIYSDSSSPLIDLCVNLEEIKLYLDEDTTPATMSILWRLKKLRKLTLCQLFDDRPILEGLFAAGLPYIHTLSIKLDGFEVFALLAQLHLYFPNLVDLRLFKTNVPENLFVSLAALDKLTSLELRKLSGWSDTIFLFPSNSGIPAISTMANLKELTLRDCVDYDMTDRSLNGIIQIRTLETLNLLNCPGFTESGYRVITDGRLKKRRAVQRGGLYNIKGVTFTC